MTDEHRSDVVLAESQSGAIVPAAATSPPAAPTSNTTPGEVPRPTGDSATAAYTGPIAGNSSGRTSSSGSRTLTPVPIAWQSWPVIDSVWVLLGLTAVVVAVPAVVWSTARNLPMAIACGLVAAYSVWRQFVPTVFELNALGVTTRTLGRSRRVPWISIDRFVVGNRGALLTSSGAPLEIFRGLYLPWGGHRDQILSSLRYYLPHAEDAQ